MQYFKSAIIQNGDIFNFKYDRNNYQGNDIYNTVSLKDIEFYLIDIFEKTNLINNPAQLDLQSCCTISPAIRISHHQKLSC